MDEGQFLTNVMEFRKGKGGKRTRYEPRAAISYAGYQAPEKQTPNDIALRRLDMLMERQRIDKSTRRYYRSLMTRDDQLRFMNMNILSIIIRYLVDRNNQFDETKVSFNEFEKYFSDLVKEGTEEDKKVVELRLAATFLRYLYHLQVLKNQVESQLEKIH